MQEADFFLENVKVFNSAHLLSRFTPDSVSSDQYAYEESETKILGLIWRLYSDKLICLTTTPSISDVLKRIILSEISQPFDPLGFFSPVVIRAKILLQSLCIDKLKWDDLVSPQTAQHRKTSREDLSAISYLGTSVARCLKNCKAEIYGFSDASQIAMAAVVFLRVKAM